MKNFILVIMILFLSGFAYADDLSDYKEKVKKGNIAKFYSIELKKKYGGGAVMDSLIGVQGAEPIGLIRAFINTNRANRKLKEDEIDAAGSIQAVNAILGVMTHD